jgi:hypothetical protein
LFLYFVVRILKVKFRCQWFTPTLAIWEAEIGRITAQAGLDKKRDPITEITRAKIAGSNGTAPACLASKRP